MTQDEQGAEERGRDISIECGDFAIVGEGLTLRVHGPTRDGIRTSDTRGWTASADIDTGTMTGASATGIPSRGEDGTLETCQLLVRRLREDNATWGEPVRVEPGICLPGVDAEARDTRDPSHRLQMNVVRAETNQDFSESLSHHKRADLPPSLVHEVAESIWAAIEHKRVFAHSDVVLVLNAIRTPWQALPTIVDAFKRLHEQDARAVGFGEIWIVGATGAFVKRLDA